LRILLDTNAWLWTVSAPERLSPQARALVEGREHELYLSAASAWEIAIKYSQGKLRMPEPPLKYVPSRLEQLGVLPLPIDQAHALQVSTLPMHHRDPFDRILIAQAQLEDLPILTSDPVFAAYDVRTIAAS
jgi:PIN domain nuclease of toxin-antitoxin system